MLNNFFIEEHVKAALQEDIGFGDITTDYLTSIISTLTWFGGFFLAVIAILPMLLRFTGLNIAFGGTSILIVVGVALETVQQLESLLVMRHYKGFLE